MRPVLHDEHFGGAAHEPLNLIAILAHFPRGQSPGHARALEGERRNPAPTAYPNPRAGQITALATPVAKGIAFTEYRRDSAFELRLAHPDIALAVNSSYFFETVDVVYSEMHCPCPILGKPDGQVNSDFGGDASLSWVPLSWIDTELFSRRCQSEDLVPVVMEKVVLLVGGVPITL